jgi:plasmid stabilization system protein ParE
VRYRELALSDLEYISRHLDKRSRSRAQLAIAAMHVSLDIPAILTAINDIALNPLGACVTSDPTVRVKIVRRYGHKIFYAVDAETVEILHVRHGFRRA